MARALRRKPEPPLRAEQRAAAHPEEHQEEGAQLTPEQRRTEIVKRVVGTLLLAPVLLAMVYKAYETGDLAPLALLALACVAAFVVVWRLSGLWPWM